MTLQSSYLEQHDVIIIFLIDNAFIILTCVTFVQLSNKKPTTSFYKSLVHDLKNSAFISTIQTYSTHLGQIKSQPRTSQTQVYYNSGPNVSNGKTDWDTFSFI